MDLKYLILSLLENECAETTSNSENPEEENVKDLFYKTNFLVTPKKAKSKNSPKNEGNIDESLETFHKDENHQAFESKRITVHNPELNGKQLKVKHVAVQIDKPKAIEEEVFIVEALLEKRGYKYLVKWEDRPPVSNSWEPRFALPECIVKVRLFY